MEFVQIPPPLGEIGEGAHVIYLVIHCRQSCMGIFLHKLNNRLRRPKFPWLMFHVISVLKMSVHGLISIEQLRE